MNLKSVRTFVRLIQSETKGKDKQTKMVKTEELLEEKVSKMKMVSLPISN